MTNRLAEFTKNNWLPIVLAIGPPLVLWYVFQRETNEITATITTDIPVVSIQEELGSEVGILFQGQPVSGIRLVNIEIRNSGTRPLEKSAFETPLEIDLRGQVAKVSVVTKQPISLQPILRRMGSRIAIEPLLLNPRDRISIRAIIVNQSQRTAHIAVSGRLKGVSDVELIDSSTKSSSWWRIGWGELASIGIGVLSSLSGFIVAKRFSLFAVRFPAESAASLVNQLEKDPKTAAKAALLAKELEIEQHEVKANLLYFRLRIETLLRDVARRADLTRQYMLPMGRLTQLLAKENLISKSVASAVADISPVLNRELHEVESYLSAEEYNQLQRLCLSIIAQLSAASE